ncbi:phosphotransferase family protein [Spirosoma endophyticum]|uniref:Predicted kinase, aminoglycoside phosphotransferase (APT) family n=1 Tax=Spirosoma endophyticum TaxID=662367 RepID=A0A1I1J3K5_9BACT|nr:phosphotransferase family protein [Spirosoma endophyticum]SFC40040.1 Predicted kinase, aminoglycoside phosphotransferase (APT) family [Spirosoma endophyticum]
MTASDAPRPVRAGEELDLTRLNAYLYEQAPDMGLVLDVRQFSGGFSNLTYWLKTATGEYVLRRPPAGANIKGGHDMGREFRVLSLLKGHYDKIPEPVVYCESTGVLGVPFYIMERVPGIILRAPMAPTLNLAPALMRQLAEALVDNLVAIHGLDIHTSGMIQLGKPEGYVLRQVEGWNKRYRMAETDKIPAMDHVGDWLQQNYPAGQAPAFLHNDYKFDNVLLAPDPTTGEPTPVIKGVLDWEMATVGDPLMDLGATLAYWSEATDSPAYRNFNLTWLSGNLTRQEVVNRYAERSSRDLSNILYYYVFGLYKNAVIAQQIYARWKLGHSQDARFGHLLPMIIELANKAASSIESGKI